MIYFYKCKECGINEEIEYPIGQSEQYIPCKCGNKMWKDIRMPPVHFLGSGFTCGSSKEDGMI